VRITITFVVQSQSHVFVHKAKGFVSPPRACVFGIGNKEEFHRASREHALNDISTVIDKSPFLHKVGIMQIWIGIRESLFGVNFPEPVIVLWCEFPDHLRFGGVPV
jgi:hypothetical protein